MVQPLLLEILVNTIRKLPDAVGLLLERISGDFTFEVFQARAYLNGDYRF
jgi:hypothetical protein